MYQLRIFNDKRPQEDVVSEVGSIKTACRMFNNNISSLSRRRITYAEIVDRKGNILACWTLNHGLKVSEKVRRYFPREDIRGQLGAYQHDKIC